MTTLLRIANEKYIKNVSHDKGFSLNGGIRNNSYVGQTSLARKTNKPYFTRYNGPAGHGGCCGKYYISFTKQNKCFPFDNSIIKNSVINTKGMLSKKNKWLNSGYPNTVVQPDSNYPLNDSASSYINTLKNETISKGNTNNCVQSTETITIINNSSHVRMNNLACNYTTVVFPNRVNNSKCAIIQK
jgi:hypothetical protein